ncbi:exopolysaccharide biosynthesis protein [Salinarimonas sp.]|uniref:exopolysaccharide biosynthesis protein n=1 Tax=Salinarimonas sp. TaxID=2766526 RepID=UPI0032D96C39
MNAHTPSEKIEPPGQEPEVDARAPEQGEERKKRLREAIERLQQRRAERRAAKAARLAAEAETPQAKRARAIHEAMEHKRITLVLRAVIDTAEAERISIREIVEAFGERAFGFVIILFSLPNCIPAPPGMNSVFGLPVLLFAVQMALGRRRPWLPRRLMDKTFKVETFRRIIDVAEPKLRRVENLCRPRSTNLFGPRGDRLIGIFAIVLAACVIVPLPGTNFVPSIALVVLAIAIMQEDGVMLGIGGLLGLGGIAYTIGLSWAIVGFTLFAAGKAVGM